ncbi:glycerol-3-phosphate acyltransferase [Chloroflexota bacterium]
MLKLITDIALVIGGYLIGAFPYMLLLSRAKGFHISVEEDFHLTVWRNVGRLEGFSGVLVDILKGVIVILIGWLLGFSLNVIALAGVAVVIGQMWPVFQKFNGEKGNTTGAGMGITLTSFIGGGAVIAFGCCLVCFAIGFLIRTVPRFIVKGQTLNEKLKLGGPVSNSLPVGMLAGFAVIPLVSWLLNQPVELIWASAAVCILIIIRRLTANLDKDLKAPRTSTARIMFNRFLFDRSYY